MEDTTIPRENNEPAKLDWETPEIIALDLNETAGMGPNNNDGNGRSGS